jgi:alpha-D-ribose 1-methylphosphonate 5-triphosphate synthase subunit PhnH
MTFVEGASEPLAHLSQRRFRALMDALAWPGRIVSSGEDLLPIGAIPPSAVAALLAIADFETAIHLSPALARDTVSAADLRFRTGARLTGNPAVAQFAVLDLAADALDIAAYHQGTAEYPDRSTTLFLIAKALIGGPSFIALGPGIQSRARIAPIGLPNDFETQWEANRASFPLGVDIVVCADTQLFALPRSIRLQTEPG